jgi:hypothetical protein
LGAGFGSDGISIKATDFGSDGTFINAVGFGSDETFIKAAGFATSLIGSADSLRALIFSLIG